MAIISFNLYDSDGNLIGNASDIIQDWGNGTTWKFSAPAGSEAATYEFAKLECY